MLRTFFRRALAAPLLLLALAVPATAATSYYISPKGSDSNPGTSAKPFKTIQQGINNAGDGDTVILEDGTYTGPGDVDLDFGGYNITVNSVDGASKAIIDCGGSSADHRAFYFHSGETAAVLSGLTIKNGNEYQGGGIFITAGSSSGTTVSINSCTFTNNIGAAVFNNRVSSNMPNTVSLTNCILNSNDIGVDNGDTVTMNGCTLTDSTKGGMTNGGSASLTNCMFQDNVASGNNEGGGLYNGYVATLTNCTFTGNRDDEAGGGVYNGGGITLTNCSFINNTAGEGGGGLLNGGANATVTGCTFTTNTAANGGGYYNSSQATVTDCAFLGNQAAGNGGGFYNSSEYSSVPVTNCIFSGNIATSGNGGAVYNSSNTSTYPNPLTLQFCTFTANSVAGSSAQGGAVENDGTLTIIDDILYGDTAPAGAEIGTGTSGSPVTTVTYTDIQGGLRGTGNINADPLFVRNPDPAASTPDYGDLHLKSGSPVIGKGIAISGVTTDKDGNTRKNPPAIGAYEYAAPVTISSLTLTPTSVTGGGTSQGKITLSAVAPTGGATIALKSSDTSSATVPSSVTIAAGDKSISFTVTTKTVTATKTVTITATIGASTKTATLTVTPAVVGVTVSSLSLSPTSVVGGSATSTGTVTLSGAAPSGGLSVTLKSSNTAAATVAATLNIPAGATSAKFKITTYAVATTTSVTITATANGTSKTATLTVTAPPVTVKSLSLSPSTVTGGSATTGTITLTAPAPSGGAAVAVTFSGGGGGTVTVPAGSTTATFTILTFKVTTKQTVTVSAALNGTTKTATLTVNPASGSAHPSNAARAGGPVCALRVP